MPHIYEYVRPCVCVCVGGCGIYIPEYNNKLIRVSLFSSFLFAPLNKEWNYCEKKNYWPQILVFLSSFRCHLFTLFLFENNYSMFAVQLFRYYHHPIGFFLCNSSSSSRRIDPKY